MSRLVLIAFVLVCGAAIGAGLMVVGGPGHARLEKQDRQRVMDLNRLHSFLMCRTGDGVLPAALDDADFCPTGFPNLRLTDQVTGAPYIYRRLDDARFEVCAVFATDMEKLDLRYARALTFEGDTGCRNGRRAPQRSSALAPMDQFVVTPVD